MNRSINWFKPSAKPNDHRGTLVGYTDERHEPVYLPQATRRGHTLLLGKGHTGKTALMAHLAKSAMREDSALIVVDVDGDLLPILSAQVPANRTKDVTWLDFSNDAQIPGWNLLDQSHGYDIETVVPNLLHSSAVVWPDNWGPVHENTLRMAVRTLGLANRTLVFNHEPQFSLADILSLFHLPTFRRRVLNTLVQDDGLLYEWFNRFENLPPAMQIEAEYPALVLLDRLVLNSRMKNILGQGSSTFNLREMLQPGSIVFINLANAFPEMGFSYWLGALIADRIDWMMLTQKRTLDATRQVPVTMAIHGLQPIPMIEQPGFLPELHKRGVDYILTHLSMSYPECREPSGISTLLSGMTNLLMFHTSALDAKLMAEELDEPLLYAGMGQLPDHQCFLKTYEEDGASALKRIQTLLPLASTSPSHADVMNRASRFSRPVDQVVSARENFEEQWYGQEMALIRAELERASEQPWDPAEPSREY
jgi:hypothetical protein